MPTKINPLPPVEELRRLFNYDPETGILTNAIDRNARVKKGESLDHCIKHLVIGVFM